LKVLVTGIYGFIGSNLAASLVSKGHSVIGIDNRITSYQHFVHDMRAERVKKLGVPVLEVDLANLHHQKILDELMSITLESKFDAVVHLAAWPGVLMSEKCPSQYFMNNVIGFTNLMTILNSICSGKFLYASSSSVYGNLGDVDICQEKDSLPKPLNYYAATKVNNEQVAEIYSKISDIEICGLRFFTVVGPWGRPDMSYWNFTEKILGKSEINLRGDVGGYRDFTDINDLTDTILRLLESRKKLPPILNIANGEPKSALEMLGHLGKNLGIEPKIRVTPRSNAEANRTIGSNVLLTDLIGLQPVKPFAETIEEFLKWYVEAI
jgi:UDP-glucuronate 4-epimerase